MVIYVGHAHGITCIAASFLWVDYPDSTAAALVRTSHIFKALLVGGLAMWFVICTNLVDGCPRIARGAPWAGSVTGGEACGYPCSEKEGFTHPSLLRAPCFWGAKNVESAR